MEISYNDIKLVVKPDITHEWLLETSLVAQGYGVSTDAVLSHRKRNSDEFIDGKHYMTADKLQGDVLGGKSNQIYWTKKGVVRLGFFIKSQQAKSFRDWAEDLIINAKLTNTFDLPQTYGEALILAGNLQLEVETLKPKAIYTDKILTSISGFVITEIAKELGITSFKLNKTLKDLGVQYKVNGVWVLTAKYQDLDYTEVKTTPYYDSTGNLCTSHLTIWTEKGRNFIHILLNKKLN